MGLGGNCGSSLRICGRTGEIARIALFLAAPESGYISGATLVVDWGSVVAGAYMVENIAAARLAKYKVVAGRSFLGRESQLCSAKLFVWRPAHHEDHLLFAVG